MNTLSPEPTVHPGTVLVQTVLGTWTEIGPQCSLENVAVGDYSYTGPWCIIQNAKIERFSNIAAAVRIGPTMHPVDRPTLHHFTYRRALYGFADDDDQEFFDWRRQQVTHVGNDTWIGHGAIIIPGVSIGNGAVVGAGAVVTHDVEPYTIVAGVPSRLLRRRFSPETAAALERTAWWTWDHQTLKKRLPDFLQSVERFLELYGDGSRS